MSGRELETASAFFPSIDRDLLNDLDRLLRGAQASARADFDMAQSSEAPSHAPGGGSGSSLLPIENERVAAPRPAQAGLRPDIADAVEAVEHAGHSLAEMNGRIDELNRHIALLESANATIEEKLAGSQREVHELQAQLDAESERAARIEAVAAQQAARAAALDRELHAAHGDLARITDAIATTLGLPQRG